MADEPPSYDNSFLDINKATRSSPSAEPISTSFTKDSKDSQGGNSSPIASTSKSAALLQNDSGPSPTRRSFLMRLRDALRKLPRHSSIESIVMDDVRTVVQPYSDSAADRVVMLDACAELCTRHTIDFSRLLQGESIQGHTVLYWAIVNGPWPPQASFELVAAVLAHSTPLKPETIREARRACVSLRSQEMFQFLRMRPEFGALSGEDRFLLGVLVPPEEITVEHMDGANEPFSVKFRIPQFFKRMSLSKPIKLEFIARGRLWQLCFSISNQTHASALESGIWCGSLAIMENSASTGAHFGIVFQPARPPPASQARYWIYFSSDKFLHVSRKVNDAKKVITLMVWRMFKR
ncbi:hypothetical protein B0H19DRAFT_173747 [Mycena capillaripes]|nr:hypothetical protein B0H19DRAFT_173747 [Mycena capillaripes]